MSPNPRPVHTVYVLGCGDGPYRAQCQSCGFVGPERHWLGAAVDDEFDHYKAMFAPPQPAPVRPSQEAQP